MFAGLESAVRRLRRRLTHREWAASRRPAVPAPSGEEPGLLLLQIDGLSQTQLERAVDGGRMPFLRHLLHREGYQVHAFYPGLPSTTAAVQAELYYGVRAAVPAFSFFNRSRRCHGVMCSPDWAKEVESACAAQAPGLLEGGSSWSNIYTGGAGQAESHFCAASIGLEDMRRTGKLGNILPFILLHPLRTLRLVVLLLAEMFVAAWDLAAGLFHGERLWPELQLVLSRIFIAVGLRELVTVGAAVDLARGLPVIHVNFVGYDEHAHRRGPGSAFAHWSLRGIDRAIAALARAAEDSPRRDYTVWVFSDHGQDRVRSFDLEMDGGIERLIHDAIAQAQQRDPAWRRRSQRRPANAWWPRRQPARWAERNQLTPAEAASFTVAGIGPVAHVYFTRPPDRAQRTTLAQRLVAAGVPGVLLADDENSATWYHPGGTTPVPAGVPALLPHTAPLRAELALDLLALARHPHAGDLVLLGWSPGTLNWTFAPEHGAHGGLAPEETTGFALLPGRQRLPPGSEHFLRPAALRTAALHHLERAPLAAVQPVPVAGETLSLRVLTYNTHGCSGMDGRISPRRIARVIADQAPDLVALQELDLGRRRSRAEDQAAIIARELGLHVAFCPTVTRGAEHYGHALLSRWPISVVRRALLPGGPDGRAEPRAALWARIVLGARPLNVITTHLGLGGEERRRQMQALLGPEWAGGVPDGEDVLLCGDFNAVPGSVPYRLAMQRLRDVQASLAGPAPLRTFPSPQPLARIDHVFASSNFVTERVRVPRNRLTRLASDHLPLVVDLALGAATAAAPAHSPPSP